MKNFSNIDMHKYDKKPISNNIPEIREEIISLKKESKNQLLSPIELQLIADRIDACQNKIKDLNASSIKVTPVLGTRSIRDTKESKNRSVMDPFHSKIYID